MPLIYNAKPVLFLADEDGILSGIVPRDLPITAGDLVEFKRQAAEVGLRLIVTVATEINAVAWLEDEIQCTANRRDAIAQAPRTVRELLASGSSYMNTLSVHLGIVDGLNDGLNDGEPFGILPPEAMAQRLFFRLKDYDRQRKASAIPTAEQEIRPSGGATLRQLHSTSELARRKDKAGADTRSSVNVAEPQADKTAVARRQKTRLMPRNRVMTEAARLAYAVPVSLAALAEMCCHGTAMTDAVRVLEGSTV